MSTDLPPEPDAPAAAAPVWRGWPWLGALAPTLVCLAAALGPMQRWPMWNDETFTWGISRGPLSQTMKAVMGDVHPPLYFFLNALVAPMLADQDESWRLTALLASLAAVPLVWLGARTVARASGARHAEAWAAIAAWIVGTNPTVVAMAVSARQYGLLLFTGAAVFAAGARVLFGRGGRGAAAALAVAVAAALYTHYAAVAVVLGLALGGAASLVGRADARKRAVDLGLGLAGGALLFLPWALGPMRAQLAATAGEATARSLGILRYAFWSPNESSPALSWVLVAAQVAGLGVAARRRSPTDRLLLGFAVAGVVVPWVLSASPRSARTRNFTDLLPAAALLAAMGGEALGGWAADWVEARVRPLAGRLPRGPGLAAAALALTAWQALGALEARPVSPEIGNLWRDIQIEGDVLAASIPVDARLAFRPYFLSQYDRYAPELRSRLIPRDADLATQDARLTWVVANPDTPVANRDAYPKACVFIYAFEWVVYAAPGPGCEALQRWIVEVSDAPGRTHDYVPFLVERGVRARDAGRTAEAEGLLARAAARIHGYSEPARLLAQVRLDAGDAAGAVEAATRAVDEARAYRLRKGLLQSALSVRAAAHEALAEQVPADADRRAITCADKQAAPWRCGTLWEFVP